MTKAEDKFMVGLLMDLKGGKKKRRNWIEIANDAEILVKKYHYTPKTLAEKVDVSEQLIRSLLSLKDLPEEVQAYVRRGDILFDSAYRINAIAGKERQIEVAKTVARLSNKVQREIIVKAKNPDTNLEDFRAHATKKAVREKLHLIILPMSEEIYQPLASQAKKESRSVEDLILKMIHDSLNVSVG